MGYHSKKIKEQKNMKDEKNEFIAIDDDGNEVTCEILFTFESTETGKCYICYTDNTVDEEGCTRVFASILGSNDDNVKLLPITSEEEWKIVETIMAKLQEDELDD